jgi:riboflavin synthase
MFTGIIETTGTITRVIHQGNNISYWIRSTLSSSFKPDQSVSHNGICLTIEEIINDQHKVTAVDETLNKTTAKDWNEGSVINLEQCMTLGQRLDGHLVQGHVDCTGTLIRKTDLDGSTELIFQFPKKFAPLIVEKGSICIDGISLTAFAVKRKTFTVTIVPYTCQLTNIKSLALGDNVNLEFDILGKYLQRSLSLKHK